MAEQLNGGKDMHQIDYAEAMALAKPYIQAVLIVGGTIMFLLIALSLLLKRKRARTTMPRNIEGWYLKIANGLERLPLQVTASFDLAVGLLGTGEALGDAGIVRSGRLQRVKLALDLAILGLFYVFVLPIIIFVALYPFEFPGQPAIWFLATATGLFVPLFTAFLTGIARACVSLGSWLTLRKGIVVMGKKPGGKTGFGRLWMLPSVDAIGIAVLVGVLIVLLQVVKFSTDNAWIVDINQYVILLMPVIFDLLWLGLIMAAILLPMGILQLAGSKGLAKAFNELGSTGSNDVVSRKS
jgi:hypothetical protein